jgi:hypothetical protein
MTDGAKRIKSVALDAEGKVTAVFSTFNVVDRDGDVVMPGAISHGRVAISQWNHGSWNVGLPPVGIGVIGTTGSEAIMTGQFFMDTEAGYLTFRAVHALHVAGIGEWSYSLHGIVSRRWKVGGRDARIIDRVTVREVSPVMQGASINTRTLDAKITDAERRSILETARRHLAAAERASVAERAELLAVAARWTAPT